MFSFQRWLLRKYPALQEISGFAFSVNQSHQEEESMFRNNYSKRLSLWAWQLIPVTERASLGFEGAPFAAATSGGASGS